MSYVDDIIVGGANMEEHYRNLELLLKKIKNMNLHINERKMQFAQNRVLYYVIT